MSASSNRPADLSAMRRAKCTAGESGSSSSAIRNCRSASSIRPSGNRRKTGEIVAPQRVAGGELDRAAEAAFRLFPLRFACVHHPQRVVRFRQQRVQLDRLLRGGPSLGHLTGPVDRIIETRSGRVRCGETRISGSKRGILGDRLLERTETPV